jgi:RNHCP domain
VARRRDNTSFVCLHCAAYVPACTNGSYRNHCPSCLWSHHLDDRPGDRASDCHGPMEPIGLTRPRGKGLAVVHRCLRCGVRRVNRIAVDTAAPDDIDRLLALPPA